MAIKLAERVSGRDNNLNLIRMIAALGVIVSHAFSLVYGKDTLEPLQGETGRTLGWFCVAVFFYISGFLIARSYARRPSLAHWGLARVLRLFPGLLVVLLLTVLVLGPLVTSLSLAEYFTSPRVWTYVPSNLTLALLQWSLPGVFEGNPYGTAINGSLWTLFYEVVCYGGVLVAGLLGLLERKKLFAAACAVFMLFYISPMLTGVGFASIAGNPLERLMLLAFPFVLGMITFVFRDHVSLDWRVALLGWAVSFLVIGTELFATAVVMALSYSILVLAYVPKGFLLDYNKLGDYSYGTYIYAFPMQQLAVFLVPSQSWYVNVGLSVIPTLFFAVLSWNLIEKPSLSLVRSWGDAVNGLLGVQTSSRPSVRSR